MRVNVDKWFLMDIYNKWHENNKEQIHPLTTFLDTVGLRYVKMFRNEYWACDVIDEQKYMIAKIKYGI